ncbi:MAG: PLDc_N domain-containing protein [Chloroflexi bacterium]|nr:PLDc_N domain-containing protein [Chloroflexota bacterium]
MKQKKQWRDLTARQKTLTAVSTLVQISLLATALWDLRRRSQDELNGSKKMWMGLVFINFIGPMAYFLVGRKRPA